MIGGDPIERRPTERDLVNTSAIYGKRLKLGRGRGKGTYGDYIG